jgi:hypothetical protein
MVMFYQYICESILIIITRGFSMNSKNALTAASLIFQSSPIKDEYNLAPVIVRTPCLKALRSLLISTIGILPPADLARLPK